jgi:chromosome segregation ATPase
LNATAEKLNRTLKLKEIECQGFVEQQQRLQIELQRAKMDSQVRDSTIFTLNQDMLQVKGSMITQQSANELQLANEKRLNASLSSEVDSLRKQVVDLTAEQAALRQEAEQLKNSLEHTQITKD